MGCESANNKQNKKSIEETKSHKNNENSPFTLTPEIWFGHKPINLDLLDKLKKSICKIFDDQKDKYIFGTGFFMIYNNNKYLLTCFHVMKNCPLTNVNIELWNKKLFKFSLIDSRSLSYLEPEDIFIIEIKDSDQFIKDIEFLDYDSNYEKGYQRYKGENILNIGYPNRGSMSTASGIIEEIENEHFYHKIDTEPGSSGSPIILLNTSYVIGIHKGVDKERKLNIGIFIGEAINYLKNPGENTIIGNWK